MLRYEKIYYPSKLKQAVQKKSGGHKTLKGAKNNDFTCLGVIIFCDSPEP